MVRLIGRLYVIDEELTADVVFDTDSDTPIAMCPVDRCRVIKDDTDNDFFMIAEHTDTSTMYRVNFVYYEDTGFVKEHLMIEHSIMLDGQMKNRIKTIKKVVEESE